MSTQLNVSLHNNTTVPASQWLSNASCFCVFLNALMCQVYCNKCDVCFNQSVHLIPNNVKLICMSLSPHDANYNHVSIPLKHIVLFPFFHTLPKRVENNFHFVFLNDQV